MTEGNILSVFQYYSSPFNLISVQLVKKKPEIALRLAAERYIGAVGNKFPFSNNGSKTGNITFKILLTESPAAGKWLIISEP